MPLLRCLVIAGLSVGILSPSVAHACEGPHNDVGFLHHSLRDAPMSTVAAKVEIVAQRETAPGSYEVEGRIFSMLRGSYSGTKIILKVPALNSCDVLPGPGGKGIVVGEVVSSTADALVISPKPTLSEQQYFLKYGKLPGE